MKSLASGLFAIAALGMFLASNAAAADIKDFDAAKQLMTDKGVACVACHQLDKKAMGPSFNAIGLFYKDKADGAATLEKNIVEGVKGVWGAGMMPPQAGAKDIAADLAKWILSLNPEGDAKTAAEAEIAAKK